MPLVRKSKPISLRLRKDLLRNVKRGHAWLYSDAIDLVEAKAGTQAVLLDRKREAPIAVGMYDPEHPIPLRICVIKPPFELDDAWLKSRVRAAWELRAKFFDQSTSGFRWIAGEGDGLPGMIVDVYDRVAVMKLDGGAPEAFYNARAIAKYLLGEFQLRAVVHRTRQRGSTGEVLAGSLPEGPVSFLENGLAFVADVWQGQKTGFFLDQRDNRNLIQRMSVGLKVLNLFSFNGGFSIAAGVGGAREVTSVDIAAPAIEAAELNWQANGLDPECHDGIAMDCFEFLERAIAEGSRWDLVICDPPSFAPSEKARQRAIPAYVRLAQLAGKVTEAGGLLALASCSSHIDEADFSQVNLEGLGRAKRSATLLATKGLPIDHPTPAAMPELRYLKFQLFRLD